MAITLKGCHVAAVRADMVKGEVKVTFAVALDEDVLGVRGRLAQLAAYEDLVSVRITESQPPLPNMETESS